MSQPLQYSLYGNESKNIRKNKTYKKKPPTKKVQSFLEAMDTDSGPADFNTSNTKDKTSDYPAYPQKPEPIVRKKNKEEDDDAAIENFTQLREGATSPSNMEYYKQYVPYYTNAAVAGGGAKTVSNQASTELLEKLNYMIHLLEEQQGDKTGNIAEELILYLFLGIFVIFIVDSFARAGKYTR